MLPHAGKRWPPPMALVLLTLASCAGDPGLAAAPRQPATEVSEPTTAPAIAPEPAASRANPAPPVTPAPEPVELPGVDALVAEALKAKRMPGCVITVGRRDGIIFQRAYGERSLTPTREAMTTDTVFDLASLTKPLVTAAAVQLLVERGELAIDAPLPTLVETPLKGARRDITPRQLLLHASGLPNVSPVSDFVDGAEAAVRRILATPLKAGPGRRFIYSDLGYIVLGELVARRAGAPLDVFARQNLFDPMAMNETTFRPPAALHGRVAPTERTDKRPTPLIRGEVHDPRAYRLGGVAGNAGLFSTANDLSRYARMLLGEGVLEGKRILSRRAVQALTEPHRVGDSVRTPGFDVDSPLSGLRGQRLSPRAYGHGGFTGTSLWLDPARDLFVLFLSNRVHPDGEGNVIRLVGEITDAVVDAVPEPAVACETGAVRPGVDVLREEGFTAVAGKRIGLLSHDAARDRQGRRVIDVLHAAPGVTLAAIFSPEHGLGGTQEGAVADARDSATGVPVHSLFGKTRTPTPEMLNGLDLIVVDLVDVGARFFTYMSTVRRMLEVAAARQLPVVLLDRPNPLGGLRVAGPVLDEGVETFVNHHRLPILHGMTAGELAALLNSERGIHARLEVVPAARWQHGVAFEQTGLAWQPPSPNLKTATSARLYPAVGLLESTNVSVGRGTSRPFEVLGAPWLAPPRVIARLEAEGLPGVAFSATELTPTARPYRGQSIPGIALQVTDPAAFAPVRTGLALARALWGEHRGDFEARDLGRMLGHRPTLAALLRGAPLARLEALWAGDLARFAEERARHLRYPACTHAH